MTQYPYPSPVSTPPAPRGPVRVIVALVVCLALVLAGVLATSWWTGRSSPQAPTTATPSPGHPPESTTPEQPSEEPGAAEPSAAEPSQPAPAPIGHPEAISEWALRATTLITATRPDGAVSAGTGIVVDTHGWVATNYHVVQGSTEITVTIWDGTQHRAQVAGRDIWRDIAILLVTPLSTAVSVNVDPDGLQYGELVWSLGNAHGAGALESTTGAVLDVGWSFTKPSPFGIGDHVLTDVARHDGVIVPGYSGGPTFDAENEIVGMTTGYSYPWDPEQYTVIIPTSHIMEVLSMVRAGTQGGHIQVGPRAWLGVIFTTDDRVVAAVDQGTAAASAQITPGAVITTIDGVWLGSSQDVLAEVELRDPGEVITLGWTGADGVIHEDRVVLTGAPMN